jgi:RHS repeat-associated protein
MLSSSLSSSSSIEDPTRSRRFVNERVALIPDTDNIKFKIFHGPSSFSAFIAYNSTTQTYTDAPGINASLVFNSGANTYTLTFHNTGEQYIFGSNNRMATDKDRNGNSLSYAYSNPNHDMASITDSQGRVTTFTHNTAYGSNSFPSGQITSLTDPAGRTVQYTYGERGNPANSLTSVTDVMGKTTMFDYSNNDLTTITDPNGNVTAISYLTGDKVSTITDATQQGTILFAYTSGNTVVTDRNGHNTTYYIDTTNPTNPDTIIKVTDAHGHNQKTTYDPNLDVTTYNDALNDQSIFSFDANNRLNSAQDANGSATSYTYPSSGTNLFYPLTQKDPQGHITSYAYDSNGNLTSATDNGSGGKGLHYVYNANGTIKSITQDVNSSFQNVTTLGYDSKGNLTSITPPTNNGSTLKPSTLTVDPNTSRVNSVTDGNNHQTGYTYDNFDRITKISYAGGATTSYTYDTNGNLLTLQDNTGLTTFTYDALNRIRTKTLPGGTVITTAYDKTGNLTSFNDGGGAVSYHYDSVNNMTVLTEPDGALTTYSSFNYSYLAGTTQTALLQSVDQLDPVSHSATHHRAYSYDSQNRLTVADVTKAGTETEKWSYAYDNAGNRTQDILAIPGKPTVTNTYTYAPGNELLTKQLQGGASTSYSYDGNGNLTGSTGGPSFTYNRKNQATNIGSDSYTYSGADQQDRVQVNTDTFVYSGLGLSARTDASGTTHFVRCSCGLLNNERTPDGKKYYYLFDGLGTIVGMTDSSGKEVNGYVYDPFGKIDAQKEQSGLNNPWKFAGGYLDSSTSLYKFGTRYYDPSLGRWTQQDPVGGSLGDLNSANRYTYANDDPVNVVDPSGRDCQGAVFNGLLQIVGTFTVAQVLYAGVIGAILSAEFFPPAAAALLAGEAAYLLYYATAYTILNIFDTVILPGCGINFSFGF